ncbi:MAG: DEAD/DEAH box helicase [Acidimicrobiales bacterium]|jgi:hypothetical protein|nr:DEAD/DEAH box helicase [Acidimicrobiales bacterium]
MARSETTETGHGTVTAEAAEATTTDTVHTLRLAAMAAAFVDAGRVVPGLGVGEDGRPRSWWWPLPTAADRGALRGLVRDAPDHDEADVAEALAHLVDAEVRARLGAQGVQLTPRRPGRRSLPEAWALSLTAADPRLSASFDPDQVRALERTVGQWVATGLPAGGRSRLCLRVIEPPEAPEHPHRARGRRHEPEPTWRIELLAQDVDEPTLLVPAGDVWSGRAPLGEHAVEELLAALGHAVRLAPELAAVLDEPEPTHLVLDTSMVLTIVQERSPALVDAGIVVQLPAWWVQRRRVALRARASSAGRAATAGTEAGLGMETIVAFRWEAALGGERLTRRDLSQLARSARAKRDLVRFRGTWVEVDTDEVATVLAQLGTRHEATVAEVVRAELGLDRLGAPEGVDLAGVTATGWLGQLLDDALHATVRPIEAPAGFAGVLRPYQARGVGWLAFLGRVGLGACLADDMGLGKTAQTIASLLADPQDGPTLVVCPVSVLGNWQRELHRFAPELAVLVHHGAARHHHDEPFEERAVAHDVVLTTYALVARDVDALSAVRWGRLVLDEAQQVKNPGARQTRAVARLRASRRVALTGTPVENRLSELWSIMHLLNPGLLGSAKSFRDRFAVPIERDHDPEATETLRRITAPFVLRRLKTDRSIIEDLPDKIELTDHCPLTREQATLYQAVVDELLADAEREEGMRRRGLVLAGLLRLKQVCNHPAHYLGDGSALAGRSGKLARTEEIIEELLEAGDKALCFTQFRGWGDRLRPYLARRFDCEVLWLHGGVTRRRRDDLVRRFQDDDGPRLLLVSLKAGGTGLNLTAATHVIHLDRWWNPAVEDQATDRAYRIGQRHSVLVHKLVTTGTVEERIDELIRAKRELAERVVGAGEEWISELTTDELRDVVALRDAELAEED